MSGPKQAYPGDWNIRLLVGQVVIDDAGMLQPIELSLGDPPSPWLGPNGRRSPVAKPLRTGRPVGRFAARCPYPKPPTGHQVIEQQNEGNPERRDATRR